MQQEGSEGEFRLGEFKQPTTDFSNPMYEAMDGGGPSKPENGHSHGDFQGHETSPIDENSSAVLSPSSIVHRSAPPVQIRQTTLNPTTVDTDKDTVQLVEEDKSEC